MIGPLQGRVAETLHNPHTQEYRAEGRESQIKLMLEHLRTNIILTDKLANQVAARLEVAMRPAEPRPDRSQDQTMPFKGPACAMAVELSQLTAQIACINSQLGDIWERLEL